MGVRRTTKNNGGTALIDGLHQFRRIRPILRKVYLTGRATIARTLASKEVSPKAAASGLRMFTYFINRAGKGLTEDHR
jgi:hypothetical protein